MVTFKEFVNAGAFGNTAFSGFDNQFFGVGKSLNLPTPTLEIPTNIIKGKVQKIFYNENPITIALQNGTIWKVTKEQWDYLKSIGKDPRKGDDLQLELYYDGTIKGISYGNAR